MIVVGGWPGRQVIGLNGRFGVRQSELASGGAEPSPFLNNFDAGDDATTEMVVVVTSLPGSGTATLTDDGDFTHSGAADGTYTTLGTVYSWSPGGPLVVHAEPESITSTFGTGVATPVGIAIESQAAQALAGRQIRSAGLAVEAAAALALIALQRSPVGVATESASALALQSSTPGAVGVAIDSQAALSLQARQIRAVAVAVEADAALALSAAMVGVVGVAIDTQAAVALAARQRAVVGLAVEVDAALALAGGITLPPQPQADADRFDYLRALQVPNGDPRIAAIAQRMAYVRGSSRRRR